MTREFNSHEAAKGDKAPRKADFTDSALLSGDKAITLTAVTKTEPPYRSINNRVYSPIPYPITPLNY